MSDAYEGRYMTADDVRGLADLWKQYGVAMERMIAAENGLVSARDRATALEIALQECRAALPDPAKLWALADWLDAKYPNDSNPEVQHDLRSWARRIFGLGLHAGIRVPSVCDAPHQRAAPESDQASHGAEILGAGREMAGAIVLALGPRAIDGSHDEAIDDALQASVERWLALTGSEDGA